MNKLYMFWILLKYKYYKLYWKIKKPEKRSQFYEWREVSYDVSDQKAIGIGIVKKIGQ